MGRKPWINFSEHINELDTGDIILFSSRSNLGRAVKHYTKSDWSHCGIIIKPSTTKEVLILEPSIHRIGTFTGLSSQVTCAGALHTVESKLVSEFKLNLV